MEKNKTLQILDSVLTSMAIFLVVAIPLILLPRSLSTKYPLVYIYLEPKIVVLRIGVIILFYSALLLSIAHLIVSISRKNLTIKISWVDIFLVAFIGLLWLSARYGLDKNKALYGSVFWREGFYTYWDYAVLFFITRFFGHGKLLVKLAYTLIITTSIISLYAIAEAFYPGIQAFTNVGLIGRSGATAGNAVILGAYLIMPLALIGGLLSQKILKGAWAVAAYTSLGLGLPAIIFTFSRGAWIALLLAALVIAWQARRAGWQPTRRWLLISTAILIIAVIIISLGPSEPQNLVARAFSAFNPAEPSTHTRLEAWNQAILLTGRFPLFGTGIDSFSAGAAGLPLDNQLPLLDKPHNFFLEVLSTMGIPAFLAYIFFVGLIGFAGVKMISLRKPEYQSITAGLIAAGAYLIALLFMFSTVNNAPLFYVIIGLIAAGARDAHTLPRVDLNRPFL